MPYQFEKSGKIKGMTADELLNADADCAIVVYYTGSLQDGAPYWAYVAVKPSMYDAFMHPASDENTIMLGDYGTILRYGFDDEAPASVKDEMKQQHGCDDHYTDILIKNVKAAQVAFLQKQEAGQLNDIVAMLKKKQATNSGGT